MKGTLTMTQENGLERLHGLWGVFEKLGTEIGDTLSKGIYALCDAVENRINNLNDTEK